MTQCDSDLNWSALVCGRLSDRRLTGSYKRDRPVLDGGPVHSGSGPTWRPAGETSRDTRAGAQGGHGGGRHPGARRATAASRRYRRGVTEVPPRRHGGTAAVAVGGGLLVPLVVQAGQRGLRVGGAPGPVPEHEAGAQERRPL